MLVKGGIGILDSSTNFEANTIAADAQVPSASVGIILITIKPLI